MLGIRRHLDYSSGKSTFFFIIFAHLLQYIELRSFNFTGVLVGIQWVVFAYKAFHVRWHMLGEVGVGLMV